MHGRYCAKSLYEEVDKLYEPQPSQILLLSSNYRAILILAIHALSKIMSLIHKTKMLSLKKYQDTILAANKAYQNAGGTINPEHIAAAFSWIGWLVYNIECDCVEQVNQTLATILQLEKVIPEVICLCREICAK